MANRRPPRPARAKRPRLCRAVLVFGPPPRFFRRFCPQTGPGRFGTDRKARLPPKFGPTLAPAARLARFHGCCKSPVAAATWPRCGPNGPARRPGSATCRPSRANPPTACRAARSPGCAASPPCRPPAPQATDPPFDPTRAPVHFSALLGESLCPGRGDQISGSDTLETARPSRVNFREIRPPGYPAHKQQKHPLASPPSSPWIDWDRVLFSALFLCLCLCRFFLYACIRAHIRSCVPVTIYILYF